MKCLILVATILAIALPAQAQNAAQIARVSGGAGCPGCNLFQGDFTGLEAQGLNLSGARLRQADLSLVILNSARFTGADLRDVQAYGGAFSGADFSRADLTNASFVGTVLDGTRFAGATLDGTNFSGARLARAIGLTQQQLYRACGDAATALPGTLRIPAC